MQSDPFLEGIHQSASALLAIESGAVSSLQLAMYKTGTEIENLQGHLIYSIFIEYTSNFT